MSRSAYNESYLEPDGRPGTHVPIRGSDCGLFVPGPRGVEVVAVALLLDSLLSSGSLPVHPGEGSVH